MNEPWPIIIFDTDCVLCSGMVAFVLAHERDRALRFAGAWSDEGSALAQRHGFSQADLNDTFLVVTAAGALTRSDGGIEILRHLTAPCRVRFAMPFTTSWRGGGTAGSGGARTARSCRRANGTG